MEYQLSQMPWYEILAVSVVAWLFGSVVLALALGRVLAWQRAGDDVGRGFGRRTAV